MIVSRAAIDSYSQSINAQSDAAAKKLRDALDRLDFSGDYEAKKAARNIAMDMLEVFVSLYGDASATIAADFYNEIIESAGKSVASAVLVDPPNRKSIEATVRYQARKIFGQKPDIDAFKLSLCQAARTYIKRMANDTVSKNAVRDGKKHGINFARIPLGAETCEFCIMLASRGFVYASESTAGQFNHFHNNCDCKIVAGIGDTEIEGYDPMALYRKWREMRDGKTIDER